MDETVKSLSVILPFNQSTFLLVFKKMTAWVIVNVSYKSHRVSNFHSYKKAKKFNKTGLTCDENFPKEKICRLVDGYKTTWLTNQIPSVTNHHLSSLGIMFSRQGNRLTKDNNEDPLEDKFVLIAPIREPFLANTFFPTFPQAHKI